jgi:heme exporter protein B
MSTRAALSALLRRDLLLAYRRRADTINPLLFALLACLLFALGIAPDQLAATAVGVVWVIALLASLWASDHALRDDFDDGSLEQMLLRPIPFYWQALAKCCAHWLVSGLPLTIIAPLLALLLHMPASGMPVLLCSMALGTATLSLIGVIGAALTASLRKGGLLTAVLVLPLYIPVLIFGVGSVQAALAGAAVAGQLAVLGALLALAVSLAPLAVSAAVRVSVH